MTGISIIVPTRNEAEHIEALIQRIDQTLRSMQTPYEVIIIDDYSHDDTTSIVKQLAGAFPITLQTKKGKIGKAYSLMQGLPLVQYDTIVTIDADLQFPPEAIPKMVALLKKNSDIVIAQRTNAHTSIFRELRSIFYRRVVGQLLHGLPYDLHSGLKVFTKDVARRLPLSPKAWTFDLEFLLLARHAGYTITSLPITFQSRTTNKKRKSNHNSLAIMHQMLSAGVYHKLARPLVIPFLPEQQTSGHGFHYNGKKFTTHTQLNPHKSALYRLQFKHTLFLLLGFVVLGFGLYLNWHTTILLLFAALTLLYFTDLLFNFYLIIRSFSNAFELRVSDKELAELNDSELPTYTIFCPLYKEPEVIPQFITAMSKLNYPKQKLQVMLLLEQDDTETIAKAQAMNLPSYFEIQIVPDSLPKTKPKACNYGLLKATGEYVVIYDAEDVPDPEQLRKAVLAFRKADPEVICIQAKLNFYNPHQNILTRVFTAEYSLWFDLVLTGIQSINAPIPLGGTSNHFRVKDLKALHGWDSFNVTEDCDLGMRLVKNGYKTAILDSTTLEEANSDLKNWFWQRSRWIKGYMQSYIVHMRDPIAFLKRWHDPHIITFQLIVGGKVLSMLINPLMWLTTISYFVFRSTIGDLVDSFFPPLIFYMGVFSLIFGNFLYLYYYMIGCAKRGHDDLIKYAIFVPLYWLGMSLAAYMALYKLLTAPHHWSKTKHGLHLKNKHAVAQTQEKIGGAMVDNSLIHKISSLSTNAPTITVENL